MRALLAFLLLAALGACDAQAPQGEAEAATPVLTGRYIASSAAARSMTGNVAIQTEGMAFERGALLSTRALEPMRGGDLIARNGDSFAAAAIGPDNLVVELRRVTGQNLINGVQGLCGARQPTYVALAYERTRDGVTLLAFTGDEAPGPEATRSQLCGAFVYDAPAGGRMREGVVLW